MPLRLTCPQGHEWEALPDGFPQPADPGVLCPVGAATFEALAPAQPAARAAGAPPILPSTPPPAAEVNPSPMPTGVPGVDEVAATWRLPGDGVSPASGLWPRVPGYEIVGELGRGGMGIVYQARQLGLNRLVALKMIQAPAPAGSAEVIRFRREAEAVARVQHPNIGQVYEVGEHDGRPFFSMELVNEGGLDRRLAGMPQPPRQAAQLVETLARAVHYAHQRGIVHRDLKPANIL